MKNKYLEILNFLNFCEKLKSTLRHNWITGGRQESVAEHTWRMALLLILVKEEFELKINLEKALFIVIIHDISEIIDGDTPGFRKNKENRQKEAENLKKIIRLIPQKSQPSFKNAFEEYEEQKTIEAKIVKVIDRLETQLQHLNSGNKYWIEEELDEHMFNYPDKALANLNNKDLNTFWKTLKTELEKEVKKMNSNKN
ncbi:HD domain-containing protein [Candidatus Beckwithbacteria bacterium]|nr:HD domain-containing protein [Candidatus Beckwithbacteria bacterium]